jgi:type IV pilus assembly protein PilY1
MKKIAFILRFIVLLGLLAPAYGMDTDLYVLTNADVAPNVLIMFDNSGSMNDPMTGQLYDPSITYPLVVTGQPNAVYYSGRGQDWTLYRDSIDDIVCENVKTTLITEGFYTGKIKLQTSECTGSNQVNLRTGNYRNYVEVAGGPDTQPKLGLAKAIIQSYVNTTEGVRFGAMIFNPMVDINGVSESEGGHLLREVRDMTATNRSDLHTAIGGLTADTWTPLAETLYEAGLYYKGAPSYFNKDGSGNPIQYTSPIQAWCQKSYVIVITDGESTKDRNSVLQTNVGDANNDAREPGFANEAPYEDDGSDYLDDVAKVLYESDLSGTLKNKQNVVTYTIGFAVDSPLLKRAAELGGGKYFYCHNAQSFITALQAIINDILAQSTSYVAPVVPISQMQRTSAGDRMYLAMFKPTDKSFWKGNIKRYGIATTNSGTVKIGDVVDVNGNPVMDGESQIADTAQSCWSSAPDGGDVERGGVGEVLQNRTTARNIYTYLGVSDLTDASNRVVISNNAIMTTTLGLNLNDLTGRERMINFVHGLDGFDENGNGNRTEKRDWILGGFIHSRPVIVHYGSNQSVIFAGAGDGMLHAFDDATGEELWAFIPPNLLPRLKNLNGATLEHFVDGAPKAYIGPDNKVVLVFGQRRGGNCYHALDVTNPAVPKFMWEISPSTPGFQELGQTWSTPHFGKIQYGAEEKWAVFFGGGFDTNQDDDPVTKDDTIGRAVYIVDLFTGSLLWSYSFAQNTTMKYCIPSDIARVDTDGNGRIDRLYVGDLGGQMWRFDIGNQDSSQWKVKMLFNSNPGASERRKIFYPPDVTLEKDSYSYYEMVFFGTGDREHPKKTTVMNRIYSVKDKNPSTSLTESDLVDVTLDLLQDPSTTEAEKNVILSELDAQSGWFIKLEENPGEKILASPVVFYKQVYFSAFMPTFATEPDPCFLGQGKGGLYILQYTTGNAAYNLDLTNDIGGVVVKRSDRWGLLGPSIPSGTIITFIGGTAVGYVGVGGGVYSPRLPNTRSLVPISWRLIY